MEIRGLKPEGICEAGMCGRNGKLLLIGGYGPLPSEIKHPQAGYKTTNSSRANCGWTDELFEFDPHTSE